MCYLHNYLIGVELEFRFTLKIDFVRTCFWLDITGQEALPFCLNQFGSRPLKRLPGRITPCPLYL